MKRCFTFLLFSVLLFSCEENTPGAVADSIPQIDPPVPVVVSIDSAAIPIDTVALFSSGIHQVCIDDYIYTACATIMVRPPEEKNVSVYAKKCFREWLKNQVGHGLLIYLGADSLGCLWTVEAEQADASGYYFARLCCRNEGHGLMYRSLLDSHLDCDYEAFDAAIAYPFNKRFDVYTEEFALERLALDVTTTEVAKAGTMANASGVGYEELKLTVNTTDGKTHRWFFIESADMCWSAYSWDVR